MGAPLQIIAIYISILYGCTTPKNAWRELAIISATIWNLHERLATVHDGGQCVHGTQTIAI